MKQLLNFPDYQNEELNTLGRMVMYMSVGLILFSLIFVATIPFLAPNLIIRAITITGISLPVCAAIILFVKRKKLRIASRILILLLWLVITISSITAGGISAPITLGYVVVILVGGLISNQHSARIAGQGEACDSKQQGQGCRG
jgi:hypothetical protein